MARFDAIGMFWEDLPTSRKQGERAQRPIPEIPVSGWTPPTEFPNLSQAVVISLDTETYDPELLEHGPGWGRNKGHIVGVSIGALDRLGNIGAWYFPMRHETEKDNNLDPESVLLWLRDVLATKNIPKVGANLQYDIGWLRHEGVEVLGELVDVQFAEALLDEAAPVALENLGQKYLNEGKESNLLYEWLSEWFGGKPNGGQRKWIYKAPPSLVGPYAVSDADLPLRLAQVMYPLLEKENLLPLFSIECRLIRLMVDMRGQGVSVDVDKAEQLSDKLKLRSDNMHLKVKDLLGFDINVESSSDLAHTFDSLGLKYPRTEKGNPSFKGDFLDTVKHPVADMIREIRKCDKLRGTFIVSYVLNSHVNGKVYGSFHQLRGEGGGTRSGRFSSSAPNLQNIPSRDDELAPLIRGLFIPDKGHVAWRKYDYSQIEYRMLIHYAIGQAGDNIRDYFNKNPDTDYHVYAQALVKDTVGVDISRKGIKQINFGLIYGMGIPTLAHALGMNKKDAKELIEAYFKGVPFAKPTMDAAMVEAQKLGVITTVLGRKSRFDLWEPADWNDRRPALTRDKAIQKYGSNIQRAYTHKALNRRLQGSAADLMKVAMLECYESGIFDVTGVPRLTVHDELDFSDTGGCDEAFVEMRRVMENALPLKVPVKADGEIGPNWGNVTAIIE